MYKKEIKKFEQLIDKVDIVSFDIFDTLLIRPYLEPVELFAHVERYTGFKGFKKERILAEKRARYINRNQEDITLEDIYANICPEFSGLKNIEILLEKQVLRYNPFVKYFYDRAIALGKKVIAISDMYLPSGFLIEILFEQGYTDISKIFVSSEYKKTKAKKHLYEEVVKDLNVKPSKILHIGDNLKSDYFSAIDAGYKALFVDKYTNKFYKTRTGKKCVKLLKKAPSLDLSILVAIYATFMLHEQKSYWFNLGYILGGAFGIGYVQYIIEQCKLNCIDNLLFVSRDGYVLQKIYHILAKDRMLENHYIYAPRLLNIKCFLDYRNNFTYLKSIFELNRDICLDFKKIPKTFKQAKEVFNKNFSTINARAKEHLLEYRRYLECLKIQNKRIATVDMTTGAFSSQAFLTNVFKEKIILGFFSGTLAENNEFRYKTFANKNFNFIDIAKINILELLFTAPELPLEDIQNANPVFKPASKNDLLRLKIFPEIEQGILAFVNKYNELFGAFLIDIDSDTCFELLELFTTFRDKKDEYYLKKISHSKDINNKNFTAIYSDLKFIVIFKRVIKNVIICLKKNCKLFLINRYRLLKFYLYEFRNL